MKNLFLLLFVFFSINLFGQEFDGKYDVNYFTGESGGVASTNKLVKVKWVAVVKGDTVTFYDSKKMSNVVVTSTLGTSSNGDIRVRTTMSKIDEKGGYSINVSAVDDFTKRVSTIVYLLTKHQDIQAR